MCLSPPVCSEIFPSNAIVMSETRRDIGPAMVAAVIGANSCVACLCCASVPGFVSTSPFCCRSLDEPQPRTDELVHALANARASILIYCILVVLLVVAAIVFPSLPNMMYAAGPLLLLFGSLAGGALVLALPVMILYKMRLEKALRKTIVAPARVRDTSEAI